MRMTNGRAIRLADGAECALGRKAIYGEPVTLILCICTVVCVAGILIYLDACWQEENNQ